MQAIVTFAPRKRFPSESLPHEQTPFVCVGTDGDVTSRGHFFGFLGLWGVTADTSNGYLEIAKVLVGVVGRLAG